MGTVGNIANVVNNRSLIKAVNSYDDTGTIWSTHKDLSRPACVYILKGDDEILETEKFVSQFAEFKGLFVTLKGLGPYMVNTRYLDIVQLPIVKSYTQYIMFPIASYSSDTKFTPAAFTSPSEGVAELMQWRKVVGDIVSVNVGSSISKTSTATVVLRNPNSKYTYKGLLPTGKTYEDYPDTLSKRDKCVFETDDIIVIALPDLNDRINIVFTGYINSVVDSTSSAENMITITCEDVTKKLRFSRTCIKKTFTDEDPDVLRAPLYTFTEPWIKGDIKPQDADSAVSVPCGIQVFMDILAWTYCTNKDVYTANLRFQSRTENIDGESLSYARVQNGLNKANTRLATLIKMRDKMVSRSRQICNDNTALYNSLSEKSYVSGTKTSDFTSYMGNDTLFADNLWGTTFSDGTTTTGTISDYTKGRGWNIDMAGIKNQVQVLNDMIAAYRLVVSDLTEDLNRESGDVTLVKRDIGSDYDDLIRSDTFRKEHQKIGYGFYFVYKNVDNMGQLPVAIISDTDQPAFDITLSGNGGSGLPLSEWMENNKLINKYVEELNWDFYADELGIIYIKPPYAKLKVKEDSNYVITNDKIEKVELTDDHTDIMTSIYVVGSEQYLAQVSSVLDTPGMRGFYADNRLIKKYGYGKSERKTVIGLLEQAQCKWYGQQYLERHNRSRSETGTLHMIGDSSIRIGNWVYIPLKNCLAYVSDISHSYSNNSYKCIMRLEYVRHPIGTDSMSLSDVQTEMVDLGYPDFVIDSITDTELTNEMTFDGMIWEPLIYVEWNKITRKETNSFFTSLDKVTKDLFNYRKYCTNEVFERYVNSINPEKELSFVNTWATQQNLIQSVISSGKLYDRNIYTGAISRF